MKIERLTNQKRAILEYLRGTSSHPDAYEVFARIRKKLPQVSLATIYRNLDTMAEKGLIKEIRFKHDRTNYDGILERHHHLQCVMCERVINVPDDILLDFEKITGNGIVALVEDYRVMLRGVCTKCHEKKK